MTCIVAKKDKSGNIWMGGDSAGSAGTTFTTLRNPKVFIIKNKFIIGTTGKPRVAQLLQFKLNPPAQKKTQSDYEYMCVDFVDAVRKCLFAGGGAYKNNELEGVEGSFLVGYRRNTYEVESNFQIIQRIQDYDAVGCGEQFALGALANMPSDQNSDTCIEQALRTASMFSPQVQAPFHIIKLKAGKK